MDDHYSIVHYLYQYFYRKVYNNQKYIFNPTQDALMHINTFLELVDKKYKLESVGINFFLRYFIFQFQYWSELEIKTFSEKIQIKFIVGKKAFERYIERNMEFDWTLYKTKLNINEFEILDFFKNTNYKLQLNQAEEIEKQRFYNLDQGLVNCIYSTTLYNHLSKLCITCKFKLDCKILLKANYNQIYVARGY